MFRYVNGNPVEYSAQIPEEDRAFPLRHDDRVALGYCAYVLLVVDPLADTTANLDENKNSNAKKMLNKRGEQEITYDSCVHEVMLMRPKSDAENKERLAAFVVSKLRMPATRAAFEEQLLRAVHGVREANAIIESLGLFMRYSHICSLTLHTLLRGAYNTYISFYHAALFSLTSINTHNNNNNKILTLNGDIPIYMYAYI
jgi:hypothetical protein